MSRTVVGAAVGGAVIAIVLITAMYFGAFDGPGAYIGETGPRAGFPEDGVYSYHTGQVITKDFMNEGSAVTASTAWIKLADGSVHTATTLAASLVTFAGIELREGDVVQVEIDSTTDYYPLSQSFQVRDITSGDQYNGFVLLGKVDMVGMDQSDDAGVVTVRTGSLLLYNGTGAEDAFAVDAGVALWVSAYFNWAAATEENFGVDHYTEIHDNHYEWAPYFRIKTTDLVQISDVTQLDGANGLNSLTAIYDHDDGTNHYWTFEMLPISENEETPGDEEATFRFKVTFPLASGDTMQLDWFAEHKVSTAIGGTMASASETVAAITTA